LEGEVSIQETQMKLSALEQNTLDYIIETIHKKGYPPSVRDIQKALGFKSTSTVYNCLQRLEAEGYIQKEDGKSRTIRVLRMPDQKKTRVPIIGKVTAGVPLLDMENYEGYINFVAGSIGYDQNNLFALKVSEPGMIEAGILDGDVVVVDRRDWARNGDIIVAMVGGEVIVRSFYREPGRFRLQPANRLMSPVYVQQLSILGKVIACLRIY
jgi:repressor LexA